MRTLEEVIQTNYCGIGEDTNQCLLAVKEWLTEMKQETEALKKKAVWEHQQIHLRGQIDVFTGLLASLSKNKSKP